MSAHFTRPRGVALLPARGALVALGLLLAAGCGSGGAGAPPPTSSSGAGQLDMLAGDAALDGLVAFEAVIDSAQLVDGSGGASIELLDGPTSFAMTGAEAQVDWLAKADVPPGSYTGLVVKFRASSLAAVAPDGSAVAVVAANDTWTSSFATPLVVNAGGYAQVKSLLDPVDSLSGDVATPPLTFAPSGNSSWDDGSSPSSIDEIRGVVTSVSASAQSFVVDAYADDSLSTALGPVTVSVGTSTVLLNDDNVSFASAGAFFGSLVPGATVVEVHGQLQSGGFVAATKVEIEDDLPGGFDDEVEVWGSILSIDSGAQSFQLLVQFVEKGAQLLPPSLGTPAVLPVATNGSTSFFLDSVAPTTFSSLAVGQLVEVEFEPFVGPPYTAKKVEIEDGSGNSQYEGWITDTSGLPGSVEIHLSQSSPAVYSGAVDSSSTDVHVDLNGASLFLDTKGKPTLSATQLLVGLKVEIKGSLTGPSSGPSIDASSLKVRAGRLDKASVTASSSAQGWFDTSGGELKKPFGQGVGAGPLRVVVDPSAVFDGDASSSSSFFAQLSSGSAEVEVFGIGTGNPNEVRAYELDLDAD